MPMKMREKMIELVQKAQAKICDALCEINQSPALKRPWERSEGGGGTACILPKGAVFERGGVNVSTVYGAVLPEMAQAMFLKEHEKDLSCMRFFATGISIVLHPYSPMIPTVHANYRYFEIEKGSNLSIWYFGGGMDLSPYYLFEDDIIHFHETLKKACDCHDRALYRKLKADCDAYFYLPHRQEHRGVGGIFSLKYNEKSPEEIFEWAKGCSEAFLPAYVPIVLKHKEMPFTAEEKHWQLIRRGRYVEFNLMYDLGTTFGLKSKGNTENILMSLSPQACWEYNHTPEKGSREEQLMDVIRRPRDWI